MPSPQANMEVELSGGAVRPGEGYVVYPARLEQGRHEYDFLLDDEWFRAVEKTELLGGKVSVHASLLTGGAAGMEGSLLSLHVKGTVQVTCDRCLEPADVETDASDENMGRESISISEYCPSNPFILSSVCPQLAQLCSTRRPGV